MRHIARLLRGRKSELATTVAITTLVILACTLLRGYEPSTDPLHGTDWIVAPIANAINRPYGNVFLAGTAAMLGLAGGLMVAWIRFDLEAARARRRR